MCFAILPVELKTLSAMVLRLGAKTEKLTHFSS
jgi:hypothetical protein